MYPWLIFSLAGLFLSQRVNCASASWINPPMVVEGPLYASDLVWQIGSSQTLSWESSYPTAAAIILNQAPLDSNIARKSTILENLEATSFVWIVSGEGLSIDTSPIFFLGLNTSGIGGSVYINSWYFNLTTSAVSSTSSSTSSTSTSTSIISINTPTSTSTLEPQTTPGPASSHSTTPKPGELSTGAVAGIAIACTVVGIALLASLGLFIYKKGKARGRGPATSGASVPYEKPELAGDSNKGQVKPGPIDSGPRVQELSGGYEGYELSGEGRTN